MKKNKLLGRIHKNAQTGLFTIPKLNEYVDNLHLDKCLKIMRVNIKTSIMMQSV